MTAWCDRGQLCLSQCRQHCTVLRCAALSAVLSACRTAHWAWWWCASVVSTDNLAVCAASSIVICQVCSTSARQGNCINHGGWCVQTGLLAMLHTVTCLLIACVHIHMYVCNSETDGVVCRLQSSMWSALCLVTSWCCALQDCQASHWKQHKATCRQLQHTASSSKAAAAPA